MPLRLEVRPSIGERLRALHELGKPNLSGLVVVTGVIGFYLASDRIDWPRLFLLIVGLYCTSAAAGALNMVIEHESDARMRRTRTRPIPSGRVSPREAIVFSALMFALGMVDLVLFANVLTASLALVTLLIYAFVYTPLKRQGALAIWVGAVPGAIPPLMGWTAARGQVGAAGLLLFLVLYIWQFPHFLALAWMYREDYRRAGFDFLPRRDTSGRLTGVYMSIGSLLLIPVSLALVRLGAIGMLYAVGAAISGVGFSMFSLRVARFGGHHARSVFFSSITYLPILLVLIVVDRLLLS